MINLDISMLQLHKIVGHNEYSKQLVFSPDNKRLAGSLGSDIFLRDISSMSRTRHHKEKYNISTLQFSQDGQKIAVALFNDKITILDVRTMKSFKTLTIDRNSKKAGLVVQIYFKDDIVKVMMMAYATQRFSLISYIEPNPEINTRFRYLGHVPAMILQENYQHVRISNILQCIRDNGQIFSKTFYKQNNHWGMQQMQKQIYFFDSNQLYIIYHRGRIIRKALYRERLPYRYAASRRFIACLYCELFYLYDLSTGVMVPFDYKPQAHVIAMNSNCLAIKSQPTSLYKLPDDLKMFLQYLAPQNYKPNDQFLNKNLDEIILNYEFNLPDIPDIVIPDII